MPPKSIVRTEVVSPDIEKLEKLMVDFTSKAERLLEQDHAKTALVYDFLFLGQPNADPPIAPFVSMVQAALTSNRNDINRINSIASKFIWSFIGLIIGGAGWFIGSTLTHLLSGK